MRARWIVALVTLIVAIAATACSTSDDGDELLIYNAQHESLTKEWIDAFTAETGIKVTYRQGGDTELGNQLVAEGAASPADVFLTENSPAMAAVERADLFADLDAETINQVPPQYRPGSGKWTGVAARTTVFAYNNARLPADRLPASLLDLQQPAWQGRWGAPPAKACTGRPRPPPEWPICHRNSRTPDPPRSAGRFPADRSPSSRWTDGPPTPVNSSTAGPT